MVALRDKSLPSDIEFDEGEFDDELNCSSTDNSIRRIVAFVCVFRPTTRSVYFFNNSCGSRELIA